ncbi:MAG: magnesium transporter CorA family protein [Oscillospiraceae bacterium]|nr:magnesium transporter CorA family protein [Oscillospiraceae bacterium]
MIHIYKTIDGRITQIDQPERGCWVSVYEPTHEELRLLTEDCGLDTGFVRSCLDEEESSRIEREGDQTLIIVDTAVAEKLEKSETYQFYTVPLGIINTSGIVFTISLRRNQVLAAMADGKISNIQTDFRTRFILQVLMQISAGFVFYLKQIDKISYSMEQELSGAMKNQEIVQLMGLEKSLVYFTTSLKANLVTIEKIQRGRALKLYPEDEDLMDDVGIEFRQAVEMATIYSGVISAMMDAFSYVIANNQNSVMWRLTIITVIIEIPNIVFAFYGINTDTLPFKSSWIYSIIITLILTSIVAFFLLRKKKF